MILTPSQHNVDFNPEVRMKQMYVENGPTIYGVPSYAELHVKSLSDATIAKRNSMLIGLGAALSLSSMTVTEKLNDISNNSELGNVSSVAMGTAAVYLTAAACKQYNKCLAKRGDALRMAAYALKESEESLSPAPVWAAIALREAEKTPEEVLPE